MKIVDEAKRKKEDDKFLQDCLNFVKEKWKPEKVRINNTSYYIDDVLELYKKRKFLAKKIAIIYVDKGKRLIEVVVLSGYENYNNLRNILKEFERLKKGVKITLFIRDYL